MATLNTKISNFINKGQTKIRELAKLLISNFDRQGYQSADSEDLLLKLYETRNFIELLNTTDRGGMTDKEINDLIDFFWKWLELNKISFVNYPNLTTNIQENIIVPSGTYALQADLVAEVQNRTNADTSLDERIEVLEAFNPDSILPAGFFDNQDASNVNVWDDDPRLHTHANKTTLDDITAGLLIALQALEAHYASIGEPGGVHVSTDDRTGWNAKVTVAQLNALSTVYAPLSHTQAGADKHTISQITSLNDVINQLNNDIANMAGTDGREVELQSLDGDEIQWRYVGDEDWISLGNFKGDDGEAGDPFTVDFRGLSSGRLSSAFDGEDEGFAYLENDTGYLYFRNPAGGPATSSAGWEDPIRFVGDNGWSPVLAIFEVSSSKAVFEIVDWVGGSGIKPVFDPGLSPPDPVRWFIGPAGVTLETSVAVNIRGPQGFGFGPIIGGAGTLAGRDAHDDKAAGFIYLRTDVSPQVIYIKNTDTTADWGGPYAWQGTSGGVGPPGSGLGYLIDQAAHGLSVMTAVAFRAGAFEQFDSGLDTVYLGLITAIGSSSLATFVQAGYVTGLSGLTPNALYYVQDDGTVTTVATYRPILLAISATTGFVLSSGIANPSLGNFRGDHDATAGVPTNGSGLAGAVVAGDYWRISVAGTIAGVTPIADLAVGDTLHARINGADDGSEFFALQANLDQATESLRGTAEIATQAESEDAASNGTVGSIDHARIISGRGWRYAWDKVKTLVQTITAKWTFDDGVDIGGSASYIKVGAGVASGDAKLEFLDNKILAYIFGTSGQNFAEFQSTTGDQKIRLKVRFERDHNGSIYVEAHFELTVAATAGATETIGSFPVPSGYVANINSSWVLSDVAGECGGGFCSHTIKNFGGTTAEVGAVDAPTPRRDVGDFTFDINADNTNDEIDFDFTNSSNPDHRAYKVNIHTKIHLTVIPT